MNGVKMPTARALSDRNKLSVLMMKNVNIQKHRNTDCAKNDGNMKKKKLFNLGNILPGGSVCR